MRLKPLLGATTHASEAGASKVLAEIFEDGGMLGSNCGKIIESFVDAGREAGRGNVVAQDSVVGNVREEARLRNQLIEQVGNVFLTFRREGLLISGAAAEGDDDDLALLADGLSAQKRARSRKRGSESKSRRGAQEFAATPA